MSARASFRARLLPWVAQRWNALPWRPSKRLSSVAAALVVLCAAAPFVEAVQDAREHVRRPVVVGGSTFSHGAVAAAGSWSVSVEQGSPLVQRVPRPDGQPAPDPGKRTALIIGINHAKGGGTLPGSVTDATNVRDALLMYGFPRSNIKMLIEGRASRAAILAGLDDLAARTPRDGLAVFAVATHTRRRGGTNELLTADGQRISAPELGAHLAKVKARMWIALPTCFAAGYAVPGIVGKNRLATFATSANQPTYQLGSAGSYLIINMVKTAMLDGYAPYSVESSYEYAHDELERTHPDRVPMISDGIPGDLILGQVSDSVAARVRTHQGPRSSRRSSSAQTQQAQTREDGTDPPYDASSDPSATPQPQEYNNSSVGVCGSFQYRCSNP